LRTRTGDLADFVTQAAAQYGFDPSRVIAAGFSNGANVAASMLLLRPEGLAGPILFRAMVPLVPDPLTTRTGRHVLPANGLGRSARVGGRNRPPRGAAARRRHRPHGADPALRPRVDAARRHPGARVVDRTTPHPSPLPASGARGCSARELGRGVPYRPDCLD